MEDMRPLDCSFKHFNSNHAFELTVMFLMRVVCIPGQCGCDSYFLRSATSHTGHDGRGVYLEEGVYKIVSETHSTYKNLRERSLD